VYSHHGANDLPFHIMTPSASAVTATANEFSRESLANCSRRSQYLACLNTLKTERKMKRVNSHFLASVVTQTSAVFALLFTQCGGAQATVLYTDNVPTDGLNVINSGASQTLITTLQTPAGEGIAVSPDGSEVVTVGISGNAAPILSVTNGSTSALVSQLSLTSAAVSGLVLSPDGKRAFVLQTFDDGTNHIIVVDLTSNTRVKDQQLSLIGNAMGMAITSDGTKLFVLDNSGPTQVLDTTSLAVLASIAPPAGGVYRVATSPTMGSAYVLDGTGGFVQVINTATYAVQTISLPASGANNVAVSPNGKTLYLTSSGSYAMVDTTSFAVTKVALPNGLNQAIPNALTVAFTPDGKSAYFLASYFQPRQPVTAQLLVVDTATNAIETTIALPGYANYLATASGILPVATTPFAKYTPQLLVAPKLNAYSMAASFTLGTSSQPLSPTTQTLTLTIGTLTVTVPAGAIVQPSPKLGLYTYDGVINGEKFGLVLTGQKNGPWGIVAVGSHAFTSSTAPLPVNLTIGTSSGTATIRPVVAAQVMSLK
jgi:DNA-binding beta-propeller fold protein YncE